MTRLALEGVSHVYGSGGRAVRALDRVELVVEPGGKILWSYTIQQNGQKFAGLGRPMRSFDKIADAIAGAPDVRELGPS